MIQLKKANALVVVSVNPLVTTNGKTFINEIVTNSGMINIYGSESIEFPAVSFEDVVIKNPTLIVLPADTNNTQAIERTLVEMRRQLQNTDAVRNNKILFIDENIVFRPGPRYIDAIRILRSKYSALSD